MSEASLLFPRQPSKSATKNYWRQQLAFLTLVSRKIRIPMHRVLGLARLLVEAQGIDERRRCAQMIINNAEETLEILGHVLEFASLEVGACKIEAQAIDIRSLVEDVYSLLAPQAHGKGICLEKEVIGSATMVGDARRLRQALVHLVSYAIQTTGEGYVRIRVSRTDARVCFCVEDSGPGISAEEMETVFDPFKNEGNLRLAIAKRLVESMGGELFLKVRRMNSLTELAELMGFFWTGEIGLRNLWVKLDL